MTSIFAVAHRGTFDQFKELFSDGDEKRVRWGKSLFIEALSNTDPAQRYPMCDFLLDRDCVLDAGTTDGTNPFHILFDEELTPLYDLVFASPDPGFDIELTGSHDTMYDVARRWPHRQALADRIARYLEARSERHTEEHA